MKNTKFHSKQNVFHLISVLLIVILGFIVSGYFDLFENFYQYSKNHENLELDEILIVSVLLLIYALLFIIIRNRQISNKNESIIRLTKQLEKEIEVRDKMQSILAHDLKSPFNSLIGFTNILIKKYSHMSNQKLEEYFNMINKTSRSTYNLLENILEWSKIQKGNIEPNLSKSTLINLFDETIQILASSAKNKNITITVNINPDIIVHVDTNMIKTVLRNIISNSIKFSFENASININTYKKGNLVTIYISDTGVGLVEEQINNILSGDYEPRNGTQGEKGSGLGLKISQEFLKFHNTSLTIESKINKGSEFSFSLPLA